MAKKGVGPEIYDSPGKKRPQKPAGEGHEPLSGRGLGSSWREKDLSKEKRTSPVTDIDRRRGYVDPAKDPSSGRVNDGIRPTTPPPDEGRPSTRK